MVTISDHKQGISYNGIVDDYYEPTLVSSQDYYPGGMLMPGRSYSSESYRFGFNGKENDNEVKGVGNQQDYGMRIYDPRIIRFNSVDPLTAKYPFYTPYQFAGNKLIEAVDLDGMEEWKVNSTASTTSTTSTNFSTTNNTTTTNQNYTVYGPYKDEYEVAAAVSSGETNVFDLNTSITNISTATPNNTFHSGSIEDNSHFIDNAAVLTGAVSTGYDAWKGSLTKTTETINGVGLGLSILATGCAWLQVRQQFDDGGISNVNPFDAVNVTIGTGTTIIGIMTYLDIASPFISAIGETLTPVGIGVSSTQAWYGLYKSMEDLNYAPSYIDGNGQPVYDQTNSNDDFRTP